MDFNEYNFLTSRFRLPSADPEYCLFNLAGEVGELMGLIAKARRDGKKEDFTINAIKEAGDILWQLNQVCGDLGFTLEEAAITNYEKLSSRNQRNVLQGSGDNR